MPKIPNAKPMPTLPGGTISRAALRVITLEKGRKLVEEGKHLEAIRLYNSVIAEDPENPDAHYLSAKLAMKLHASRSAVDHMRKALIKGSGHLFMHFTMAEACLDHGLPDDALEHIEKALQIKTDSFEAKLLKAKILQRRGDHTQSTLLSRALLA